MARRRWDSWGWGYTYTSTAQVERSAKNALEKARKKGLDYHPVIIEGNKIAKTWWGSSWCANLERYADFENRLPRGRSYVRHGAVVDLELGKGEAHAKVQGSSLYKVDIRIDPLDKKLEKELGNVCSEQIQNVEDLLNGKFPETLKERFFARGALFPTPSQIHFKCSCPDWATMCKHVAAAMYGIGARLDAEPLGFFDLRGIRTDDFVAKAVKSKVESMLQNAEHQSERIIPEDQLADLFGMDIGGGNWNPAPEKPAAGKESSGQHPEPSPKQKGKAGKGRKARKENTHARDVIEHSGYSDKIRNNLLLLVNTIGDETFGSARVMQVLDCSVPTAISYLKRLHEELGLTVPAEGKGRGKYRWANRPE